MRHSLLAALVASLVEPMPAAALTLSDSFAGGSLDPLYWEVSSSNGSSVDVSAGQIIVTQMGGAGVTSINFRHPIAGDYSATIEYELPNWPANNLERIGLLIVAYGAAERVSDSGFGGEVYLSDFRGGGPGGVLSPSIATTDTFGVLRVTRTGTQVCASYFDGLAFQDLQCLDDPAVPDVTFAFQIWRDVGGGDGIQVAFDGFELEAPDASICGDGVEEGPETCDDGNTAAGDGCDASCQAESPCAVAPILACAAAGKASLSVDESKPGKEKLKVALKKLAAAVPPADLGDPVAGTTRYDVCLYDAASQLVRALTVDRAGQSCGSKPCWKAAGSVGFKYKDPAAAASGVRSLQLKSGDAGKGGLSLQAGNQAAKGQTSLPTGIAAALQNATSATVQVLSDVPSCFEAELGTVKKADGTRFQAAAP